MAETGEQVMGTLTAAEPPAKPLDLVQWLICVIASIGFAFDIYELLMAPLVFPPALPELTGFQRGTPQFAHFFGILFYVPALCGGVFGLLGGYLTDRYGRRRILTFSILLYAFSALAAGFSTSFGMLLFFRCTTFVGVCVEFVAAVAWLAELFPNPKQRERVLGYTQAFSSLGGLMIAVVNGLAVKWSGQLPALGLPDFLNVFGGVIQDPHAPWRYTLISGLIPAIPLILIRPFLPESPIWQRKKAEGTLKRPSLAALFAPQLRRTTVITTLMVGCAYGAAFGAIQQIPQIVPGLPEVERKAEGKPVPEQKKIQQATASKVTQVQEIGGLAGRMLLALLAVRIVGRRRLIRVFQIPGMIALPVVFALFAVNSLALLCAGIFVVGMLTVGQFSFWGNYLPRVYPVHLRGTGEGFAANIGGRMIGTSFAYLTSYIAVQPFVPGGDPPTKLAFTAASVGFAVFAAGFALSFLLPEPAEQALPE